MGLCRLKCTQCLSKKPPLVTPLLMAPRRCSFSSAGRFRAVVVVKFSRLRVFPIELDWIARLAVLDGRYVLLIHIQF